MICAFFFYGGGKVPGRIKNVKEWKREKDKAFYILGRTDEGEIDWVRRVSDGYFFEVKRLSDGFNFELGYVQDGKYNSSVVYIEEFCEDLIHVNISYTVENPVTKNVSVCNKTIPINDIIISDNFYLK